jgi:hypothetical protein
LKQFFKWLERIGFVIGTEKILKCGKCKKKIKIIAIGCIFKNSPIFATDKAFSTVHACFLNDYFFAYETDYILCNAIAARLP